MNPDLMLGMIKNSSDYEKNITVINIKYLFCAINS